uniref:C-type lectin domain containing 11A n=1 Tax=Chelonoidis abingdonii TaxID=106734 RepID=A0A8C0QP98_CHEAB
MGGTPLPSALFTVNPPPCQKRYSPVGCSPGGTKVRGQRSHFAQLGGNQRSQTPPPTIAGCLRGRRLHAKCFLIVKQFEGYDGAQELCRLRGGNLAMPADAAELATLRRYLHEAFQPFNWPAWVGIHDRRAEGLWLYESGQRVSFFDWYQDHLVSQPNGGARENCVSLSSDDGKWWDNDCTRRMYYICEYRL